MKNIWDKLFQVSIQNYLVFFRLIGFICIGTICHLLGGKTLIREDAVGI